MFDYGEACPISRATSVLCERWTLQIIREMLLGATRFSELQRYLPKMSPTLLNSRLRMLEEQGIIIKKKAPEKRSHEYILTPSGMALQPILSELGKWGMQWVFDGMSDEQLNISTIVRDFAFSLDLQHLPSGDFTLQFSIKVDNLIIKKYALVRDGKTQVCEDNPGHEVDVYLTGSLKTFYEIWFGELDLSTARKNELLTVVGNSAYIRHIQRWLRTSQFSSFNKRQSC